MPTAHWRALRAALLSLSLLATACTSQPRSQHPVQASAALPDSLAVTHAKGFRMEMPVPGVVLLHILRPAQDTQDSLTFVLTRTGVTVPAAYSSLPQVQVPVQRMALSGASQAAMAAELGAVDAIVGLSGAQYAYHPTVKQALAEKRIQDLGQEGLNPETLLALKAQAVVTTAAIAGSGTNVRAVSATGLPLIPMADWLEETPLGRAEWIKLMGVLTGTSAKAAQLFQHTQTRYDSLKALARGVQHRPMLLVGLPYKDVWYVPGGNSYMAHFFMDAGATYPWAGQRETGGLPLSLEAILPIAQKAEFWFNPGQYKLTRLDELRALDPRFASFPSLRPGKVWIYNRRLLPDLTNDFWERGLLYPDRVLADLLFILHPELMPGYQLEFYLPLS